MASPYVDRLLGRASGLDGPSNLLMRLVSGAYGVLGRAGRPIQSFFNGTWIGHPLHPMLTDVPIGVWSAVLVLDLIGMAVPGAGLGPAATIALWLGVLAALGTVVSGLTDWKEAYGYEQRVGFVHGLLMMVSTLLYVVSGIVRVAVSTDSEAARLVAIAGWIVLVVGGYLGGEMAFAFGSMVDHNAFREGPRRFVPAAALEDLKEGINHLSVRGEPILVIRRDETLHALGDVCSHAGGPLHEGTLTDGTVECPWHGSCFRIADGSVARGPAVFPQPRYEVRVTAGQVEVRRVGP